MYMINVKNKHIIVFVLLAVVDVAPLFHVRLYIDVY